MKYLLLNFLLLFVLVCVYGQNAEENKRTIDFLGGAKLKVSPIYPKGYPDFIPLPASNAFEQTGKHLSGPGIELSQRIKISNSLNFILNEGVRYDYLYQRFSLEQTPPPDFEYSIKRKIIYDLFAEIEKELPTSHISHFSLFFGTGIYGLNTGYYLTERFYQTPSIYTERTRKKNFIFPAIFAGIGWNYKNIQTLLRIGYCRNDPTLLNSPFIFPEISFRYKFASLLNTNGTKQKSN